MKVSGDQFADQLEKFGRSVYAFRLPDLSPQVLDEQEALYELTIVR